MSARSAVEMDLSKAMTGKISMRKCHVPPVERLGDGCSVAGTVMAWGGMSDFVMNAKRDQSRDGDSLMESESEQPELHSVAECDLENCLDCWEFWRDEMVDSREGEE